MAKAGRRNAPKRQIAQHKEITIIKINYVQSTISRHFNGYDRLVARAVRPYGHVPLALCAPYAWPCRYHGPCRDLLLSHQKAVLERCSALLAKAFRHQLCYGCGHWHYLGVSVRHQLEQLLVVCRRHLWCALGHRRHCGLLYGKYVCGCDVLRMEKGFARFPPCINMAHRYRRNHFGLVDIGGQCLDAISRGLRVQSRYHAQRDGKFRRCGLVSLCH